MNINIISIVSDPFLFAQSQENVGVGIGAYAGWGVGFLGGSGSNSAPSSGNSSAGYAEADAGWGIAGSASGNLDANGNVTAYSGTVPYKIGSGYGAGAFGGISYTQTAVSPSLQDLTNAVSSIFSSPSPSSTSNAVSNTFNSAIVNSIINNASNSSSEEDGASAADGGFVLYPNMSNTNQMQSVYKK